MKIPLLLLIRRTNTRRKRFVFANPEPRTMDRVRLFRTYMRVVKHWADAKGAIMAQYALEVERIQSFDAWMENNHSTWTVSDTKPEDLRDSIDDLNATIDSEGSWLTRIFVELRAEIEAWALQVEAWQRGKWRGAVLSASGVDLDTMLYAGDVEQTVQSRILANLELIKDVDQQQRQRMANVVFQGLNQRLPARDVARQLDEVTGFGRKRSLLIASVELQKIATALSVERAHQAGLGGRYEWAHSKKAHPRIWHRDRDGKIFDDAAEKGSPEYVEPSDRPGIPVRCGCRRKAVLELDEFDEDGNLIE